MWHADPDENAFNIGQSAVNTDSLLLPECVYRPGSFSGLMMLYESNFLKFDGLAGRISASDSFWISRVRGDNDLYLNQILKETYTTTFSMTYRLRDGQGGTLDDPDMTIRIYHDAGQAEAVSCRRSHRHQQLREISQSHDSELNRRWRINMMLNKWLDYLFDKGHGFA